LPSSVGHLGPHSLLERPLLCAPPYHLLVVRVSPVYRVPEQRYKPRLGDHLTGSLGGVPVGHVGGRLAGDGCPAFLVPRGGEALTVPSLALLVEGVEEVDLFGGGGLYEGVLGEEVVEEGGPALHRADDEEVGEGPGDRSVLGPALPGCPDLPLQAEDLQVYVFFPSLVHDAHRPVLGGTFLVPYLAELLPFTAKLLLLALDLLFSLEPARIGVLLVFGLARGTPGRYHGAAGEAAFRIQEGLHVSRYI
jgi:hypothetical protein